MSKHRVGRVTFLRLEIDVRVGVLNGSRQHARDHRQIQRQLIEDRNVGRSQVVIVSRKDSQESPRLAEIQRDVFDRAENLIKRQHLEPRGCERGGDRCGRLLRSRWNKREPGALDSNLIFNYHERLDDGSFLDHVLRVELQSIERIARHVEEVRVNHASDGP